jgi:putative nucleotidyltransferase with HDIG domain
MLLDKENGVLEIEVAYGLPDKVIKETKIKLGEGIAGKVALEGKARLLKKGIKEAESKTETTAIEVPSALSVPLKLKEKIIGVLNVKDKAGSCNFTDQDMEILTMLASLAAVAIENAELHNNLEDLFVNSIRALANAIEARDPYTRGHSERVTEYSVKISEYIGIEIEEIKKIRYAALLHDIGKINIKEEILNKPGRLTDEEFKIMHKHPTMGAKIMEPVKEFKEMLPYMYHHHERYGAGGYPDGVRGEQIPLPARILAVADAFDAMTTDRPYRKALPLSVALDELQKNSGTQFDPKIVNVFLRICDKENEWIMSTMDSFRDKDEV